MKIDALGQAIRPPIEVGKFIALLAWLIALVALLRIVFVVLSSPVIGYANNYDFTRTSACTGIWQSDSNGRAIVNSPDTSRPTRLFVYNGEKIKPHCMRSSEVIFSKIISLWHVRRDSVDIREISALKVGLLVLAFGALLRAVRRPTVKLMLAVGLFLSLSDATITPYFNTLYTDSTTLPALFVAIAACVWVGAMPIPPSRWQLAGCAAVMLWLAASKQQYGPLAATFTSLIALLIWLRWRHRTMTASMASCALLALVLFSAVNYSKRALMDGVAMANNSSMVLGAVLPEALDKPAAMRMLGLPEKCLPAIGQAWYTPGFQQNNPCPEVQGVSRMRLIPLFISEPQTFWQPMRKGLGFTRPFNPQHLGVFEDRKSFENPVIRWITNTSLSLRIAGLSDEVYRFGVVAAVIAGVSATVAALLLAAFSAASSSKRSVSVAALLLFGLGGITILYALASSVFGDGYADFEKHAAGMVIGFGCQAAALLMLPVLLLVGAAQAGRRRHVSTASGRQQLVRQPFTSPKS